MKKMIGWVVISLMTSSAAWAQSGRDNPQTNTETPQKPAEAPKPTEKNPPTPTTGVPAKTRVLVTDSQSWEQSGGFVANSNGAAGFSRGGARPQTAEVVKTMGERCPEVIVTRNASTADYVLLLDHEGGKGYARKDNKFALFNKDGDAIASGSTRSLGNAIKDACDALPKGDK